MLVRHCLFWILVGCGVVFLTSPSGAGDENQFATEIQPILQSHCIRCHGPELQEGGIRLDTISVNLIDDRVAAENWHEVLNVLQAGEMPPENEPQLSSQQLQTLTDWVALSVQQAIDAQRQTDGRVVMRRLNRVEYEHTMRDLLGQDMDYARDLPPDAMSADGFHNDGRSLQMSSLQFEYYLATARRALERVIVQGEQPPAVNHKFLASNVDEWLGDAERSNRLGRRQEFLARMLNDYPEDGDFVVRVQLTAELKPATGFPLLEVSVGYRPDTELLMREFDVVEITSPDRQTLEFRGRLENFPLPVRGQGKYPGLVVRVRNAYDDKSPLPQRSKDDKAPNPYPDEPHLPTLTIESVEFQGNAYDQWPPASHQRILFAAPGVDRENTTYIAEVLQGFMGRAFRRPVDATEVSKFVDFYQTIRPEFPTFEETIREVLAMVLVQPEFLYLLEPAGDERRLIHELELASRLSYFLWSTMPDDRLMELAVAGKLRESLAIEIERMLADSRSRRFVDQFTDQWLNLHAVDNVAINRDRFPNFDDRIKHDMCGETRALFAELLQHDLSAIQLLSTDFTMLNEPLAKHYGIPGVYGRTFRRVPLDPDRHRGGLLSHASVLLSNSTGTDSHPVRRAVWIRDRLLNDPPPPPPPNVPSLAESNPEFHQLSVREQLELHRSKESCNQCHRKIDGWGLALENFDAVGNWRNDVQRPAGEGFQQYPIDATVELPGGQKVAGADGLRSYLAETRKSEFARSLVSRLLSYALGRSLELSDQPTVDHVLDQFAGDNYRLRGLVQKIVMSEPFQTK